MRHFGRALILGAGGACGVALAGLLLFLAANFAVGFGSAVDAGRGRPAIAAPSSGLPGGPLMHVGEFPIVLYDGTPGGVGLAPGTTVEIVERKPGASADVKVMSGQYAGRTGSITTYGLVP